MRESNQLKKISQLDVTWKAGPQAWCKPDVERHGVETEKNEIKLEFIRR